MDCKVTFKYDGNNKELKILNTYIKEIKYNISMPKINGKNKTTKGNTIEITGRLTEIESEKDCEREENLLSWTTEEIKDIFNYYRNIELEISHKDEIVRKNKFYFMEIEKYETDLRENIFKLVLKQKLDRLTWVAFTQEQIEKLDKDYNSIYQLYLEKIEEKEKKKEEAKLIEEKKEEIQIPIIIPTEKDDMIELKNLAFNYDISSNDVASINVAKDIYGREFDTIDNTEQFPNVISNWVKGTSESPIVVYTMLNHREEIKVRLKLTLKSDGKKNVYIKLNSSDLFGESEIKQVNIVGKKEGEEIITELAIKNNKFEKVEKKEVKITLLYGFEENKINLKLEEFNIITYIFLNKPIFNWVAINKPENKLKCKVPFREVLDIVIYFGNDSQSEEELLHNITYNLSGIKDKNPKFIYSESGKPCYTTITQDIEIENSFFNVTRFSLNFNDKENIFVNCFDCAAIVQTFTNLLGCEIKCVKFGLNPKFENITVIGNKNDVGFFQHCVNVKNINNNIFIYDACIIVDNQVPIKYLFEDYKKIFLPSKVENDTKHFIYNIN